MKTGGFAKILLAYFAVAGLILVSNFVSTEKIGGIGVVPGLLSVLLLIPLWAWHRNHLQKVSLSKQIQNESKRSMLYLGLGMFLLALIVRVPSILFFGSPYEKTPLIFLVVLSVVVVLGNDVSAFGFKTRRLGRALLLGLVYYAVFGLLPYILMSTMFYAFKGQMLVAGFNPLPFLFAMPFMTFCVGIGEEGLFRGYMQTSLRQICSIKKAVFLQALLFGLWHFVWHVSPLDWSGMLIHIGDTFIVGLLFGYFYGIAVNLTPLVLAHGLVDSVPQGFVENPSSSIVLQGSPLFMQILIVIVPFIVSWTASFLLTRFLIKTTLGLED